MTVPTYFPTQDGQRASASPDAFKGIRIPPIVDGFLYNPRLRYWTERYYPLALAQMEVLRRATSYRMHLYVAPDDLQASIGAYDTQEYQVSILPDSWVWGLSFVQFGEAGASADPTTDMLIRITESGNDVGFTDDWVQARNYSIFGTRYVPVLVAEPRPIVLNGLLNVEIANTTAGAITCQLVIWVAEPCLTRGVYTECDPPCGTGLPLECSR